MSEDGKFVKSKMGQLGDPALVDAVLSAVGWSDARISAAFREYNAEVQKRMAADDLFDWLRNSPYG